MNPNLAKTLIKKYDWDIERLNVHTHQGCNLFCYGCSHHSETIHPDEILDCDIIIKDLTQLLTKIKIGFIAVLGGEPLLNPEGTKKVCNFLLEKNQNVKLVTNGFFIIENYDWIVSYIKRGMVLKISVHLGKNDKGYEKLHKKVLEFCKKAQQDGIGFKRRNTIRTPKDKIAWIEISPEFERKKTWFSLFKFEKNRTLPYNSDATKAFYDVCESACPQLYLSKLYKCSHTAYLKEALQHRNEIHSVEWEQYMHYTGYNIYDDNELLQFKKMVYKPEQICSSCPDNPEYITINQDYSIKKKKIITLQKI